MRISTLTGCVPPTRSISRSWMARSSLACRRTSISLISSSSSVPPSASSNLPMRRATAPVKAPFSWPNSSDSSRFSGIAAQLTAMNGLSARRDFAVDVARQHFLAGAASPVIRIEASDWRDLVGEARASRPCRVAVDDRVGFPRRPRPARRRSVRHRAAAACIPWRRRGWRATAACGVGADAAGDDRDVDALRLERVDQRARYRARHRPSPDRRPGRRAARPAPLSMSSTCATLAPRVMAILRRGARSGRSSVPMISSRMGSLPDVACYGVEARCSLDRGRP